MLCEWLANGGATRKEPTCLLGRTAGFGQKRKFAISLLARGQLGSHFENITNLTNANSSGIAPKLGSIKRFSIQQTVDKRTEVGWSMLPIRVVEEQPRTRD